MARAPKVTVKIDGEKEVLEALRRKGREAKDVLERAAMAGAEVIREEAARRAPQGETGFLAEHIEKKVEKKSVDQVQVVVGPEKDAFYGLFVEFGVDTHHIGPNARKALKIAGDETALRAWAEHLGFPAKPFMRPAFDEKQEDAQAAINAEFKKALGL